MAISRSLSPSTDSPRRTRSVVPPVRPFGSTPAAPRIADEPPLALEADVPGDVAMPHQVWHVPQQRTRSVPSVQM